MVHVRLDESHRAVGQAGRIHLPEAAISALNIANTPLTPEDASPQDVAKPSAELGRLRLVEV